MKKLIGLTAIISGILLMIVPRYVLPACEYEGFARMHCSDTAHAEQIVGVLLLLAGILTLLVKSARMAFAGGGIALILSVASYFLPDKIGFCHSSQMPCNYGMVPAIRFIAIIAGLIMAVALIVSARRLQKKGTA
ncbi:MAG TPA: DUF4418 family protein [Nitrospirota bacterium]|nr:DUF4418 family protein [Nitrospirota bacterium]